MASFSGTKYRTTPTKCQARSYIHVTVELVTWQGGEHGGEGTELQLVHDAEAGKQFQGHQSPTGEEQGEVQTLSHDAQPQDPWKEIGRVGVVYVKAWTIIPLVWRHTRSAALKLILWDRTARWDVRTMRSLLSRAPPLNGGVTIWIGNWKSVHSELKRQFIWQVLIKRTNTQTWTPDPSEITGLEIFSLSVELCHHSFCKGPFVLEAKDGDGWSLSSIFVHVAGEVTMIDGAEQYRAVPQTWGGSREPMAQIVRKIDEGDVGKKCREPAK